MKQLISFLILITPIFSFAQDHGFAFGETTWREIEMKIYEPDTTARAVVLREFGEAYIDNGGNHNLIFEHHFKIKILKKNGLDLADITIPLIKYNSQSMELLRNINASSFSLEAGQIKESKLEPKRIFTEHYENGDLKKFAIPNVQVGSIIEVQYTIEKPNIFNFKRWEFQRDIPVIESEYWATIPANYEYNIALRGFLKLSKNESELIKDGFQPGGGNKADCTRMKFSMNNIPAFIEEEYMTASKNYLSSLNFELSEVKYFRGGSDKITKEWKDVEEELRRDSRFGIQLKRGKDIMDASVEKIIADQPTALEKAQRIYDFVVSHYSWNGEYGKYCENGIKKAFDNKKGNVGDLNLSLIAALRFADLDADPVILSTRDNGYATELYPVLSEFNYVIARVTIDNKIYLLDATDPLLPFGLIPYRCLNGKGRVIGDRQTSWQQMSTGDKFRKVSYFTVKFNVDGSWSGVIQNSYIGYEAYNQRRKILRFSSQDEYAENLDRTTNDFSIEKVDIKNLENINEPLVETLQIQSEGGLNVPFLFNPFLMDRRETNPFKSSERLYPVDFGAIVDERTTINIEIPEGLGIEDLPDRVGLGLPNDGGKYLFDVQRNDNSIVIVSWLNISRPLFSSEEYYYLKELFNRIVQVQNTDLVFKKG